MEYQDEYPEGVPLDACVWDAQAALNIGLFMTRYLQNIPAPEGSEVACQFERWAADLVASGRDRLGVLEVVPLRAVG